MSNQTEQRILSLIGEICTKFSNLEFYMSLILAELIDTSEQSVAGNLLVDDFTLSKTTVLIPKLARYRFVHDESRIIQIESLCKAVDNVRLQRNLFVHGMWSFNQEHLNEGEISVLDTRWKECKGEKRWSRFAEHILSEDDLTRLRSSITEMVHAAFEFESKLTPNDMQPHQQKSSGTP